MAGVRIAAVGDLFPNGPFVTAGSPTHPEFDETLTNLQKADLRFGTLLMPLSERGEPTAKLANIRAHPDVAHDLATVGLDLVSLANNHALDFGPLAAADTVDAISHMGARSIGIGRTLAEATAPVYFEVNGLRIGVVAYSCLVPPGADARVDRYGIAPIRVNSSYEINAQWEIEEPGEPEMVTIHTRVDADDERRALEQVAAVRAEVDVLCATIHWGFGATEYLAEYQRPLGHALIDAGADAVLGHHVHAVHGVEMYKGRPILYSPGNFVGRQIPEDDSRVDELAARLIAAMSPDGYIAQLDFDGNGSCAVELRPTSMNDRGLPGLARGAVADRICERIERLSAKWDTSVERRGDSLIVRR
jgi:poly-gamma-glutamate capsule biosynthesis protein CapA/YwtB (metallophosphatase superfamily)